MTILNTCAALNSWREEHSLKSIGFVPTMGALHEGHLSLCKQAKIDNDIVIASIFVNPTQFAPHEDFDAYPRMLETDAEKLGQIGVDAIWAPTPEIMYPEGFKTTVHVDGMTQILEGAFRPTHFDGVTTVVAKLFGQVRPTRAYFGEKDYQQLQIIKRMTADMNINTTVIGCPIVRDAQGLALSSRNAYLSDAEIEIARQLNQILKGAKERFEIDSITQLEKELEQAILDVGFDKVDYVAIRNAHSLAEVVSENEELRILAAATINKTRLIDNMPL